MIRCKSSRLERDGNMRKSFRMKRLRNREVMNGLPERNVAREKLLQLRSPWTGDGVRHHRSGGERSAPQRVISTAGTRLLIIRKDEELLAGAPNKRGITPCIDARCESGECDSHGCASFSLGSFRR